jgi:beta-lactam-binding protein with PASTA domain
MRRIGYLGAMGGIVVTMAACGSSTVRVPNVIGFRESAAQSTMNKLGLEVRIVDQRHATPAHPTSPQTVISQTPPAGVIVQSGGKVSLVVYLAYCSTAAPCVNNVPRA